MEEPKKLLRDAMKTIPELKEIPGFRALLDRLPARIDFKADCADFEAIINADIAAGLYDEFDASLDMDCDVNGLPPAPTRDEKGPRPSTPSVSDRSRLIAIRIPSSTLSAVKAQAKQKGVKYQTLINRMLKACVDSWKVAEAEEHPVPL